MTTRPRHPVRSVLRRWRTGGITWALLECQHEVPCNAQPIAEELTCTECLPTRPTPPREATS
jgi:hypothetical protein